VRIVGLDECRLGQVAAYGSVHAQLAHLTDHPVSTLHVAYVTLAPGGRLGRHPAAEEQWLIVLTGQGMVSGASAAPVRVRPGDVVMWETGEPHDTVTAFGFTGLVLEGPDLKPTARWSPKPRGALAPWVWWSGDRTPFWPLMQEADEDAERLASYWTRGHLLTRCDVAGHPVAEALWDQAGEDPELLNLAVDTGWRRTGLGSEAVALVREQVAAAGFPRLLAATTPAGVGFYLRLGFRLWAVRRDAFRPLADIREDGVLVRDQIVLEIPAQPPMTTE